MEEDWDLSSSLTSDGQGVRDIAVVLKSIATNNSNSNIPITPNDMFDLWAGSQAGSLVRFGVPSGDMQVLPFQHDHAVTAVATAGQCIVTGCKDAQIRVFDAAATTTASLVTTLQGGHEKPVTVLQFQQVPSSTTQDDGEHHNVFYLLSGSWDGTAKIWKFLTRCDDGRFVSAFLLATLPGHENSVCATFLPSTITNGPTNMLRIATGSAGIAQNNRISGHAVRLWKVDSRNGQILDEPVKVSDDHEGPIRGICYLEQSQLLATCSNDGTVKLRSPITGHALTTLTFVPQGSSSTTAPMHPPMLLSVTSLPDDDTVVAAAEDGHVIVWNVSTESATTSPAAASVTVVRHATCVWRVVPFGKTDFATACDDGVVRIFTRATERMASEEERARFRQAAEAAMQASQSGPTMEEIAKLPAWEEHNTTKRGTSEGQVQLFRKGNIAIAAQWSMVSQCWIEVGQVMGSSGDSGGGVIDGVAYDHVLPIEVDTTGGQVARLSIGYNTGENPFTAAQRFIDAHMLPQYHLPQIADYIQQRVGQNQTPTIGMTESASGPVAATGVPAISYEHLPSHTFMTFPLTAKTVGTLDKMKQKIVETCVLSEPQLALLSTLLEVLSATNRYHASIISDEQLQVLSLLLDKLPNDQAFPALDIARIVVLHPDAAKSSRAPYWTALLAQAISMGQDAVSSQGAGPAVPMLSLRLVANAFKGGPGSLEAVQSLLIPGVSLAVAHLKQTNKNVRLSVATVIYNACHAVHSSSSAQEAVTALIPLVLPAVDHILTHRTFEETAVWRTLVALGTLVLASAEAKAAAQALFLAAKVELAASPHSTVVKESAREVYRALQ